MSEQPHKLQPMGILDILKTTIKLYQENFALFLEIVAILFAPIIILSGLWPGQFAQVPLLLNFLIIITMAVATEALTLAVCGNYLNEQLTLKQVLERIKQYGLFTILSATVLVALLVVGFDIIRIGLLRIGIIGGILLVPTVSVFLWILVNWSLFVQSITIEKRSVIDSLRRSKEMVGQSWWRVFGLLLVLALSIFISMWIAGAIGEGITNAPTAGLVFSLLAIVFTAPLYIIGTTLLYFDLRVRKEDFNKEWLAQHLKVVEAPVREKAIDENYERKTNALYIVLAANLFLIALKF
ncbi:MAG: hypothetical protein ACE5NG_19770, partial [bacterium]